MGCALVVTAFALLPLAFIAWVTIETGWSMATSLIFRPRVGELLANTILLVVLTLPLCVGIGVGLAWLTERTDLPGARAFAWLAIAPLAVPAFVHSYAWVGITPGLHGISAGVLVSTLAYFPFMYLPVAAALRRLDPGLEDTAASLGLAPLAVFQRVVLPQLRPAILAGALIIGLHLLAEYGLYAMIRFDTFTTAIVDQFKSTFSGPAANMLSGVLVVCCLALLALENLARGDARYARVGTGSPRRQARMNLGATMPWCLLLFGIVIGLSLGVPMLTLAGWLVRGGAEAWRIDEVLPTLFETAALAAAGALGTTIAAFPIAWLSVRYPTRFARLIETGNYFVGSLPGVVVALALVTISIKSVPAIYQTVVTVLLAYVVLFLPRAIVNLKVSIAQVPSSLEDAAASLGRTPLESLAVITLRLAAPGVASALALVALGITNELTATLMLAPNGTQTLATQFWAYSSEIDYAGAAPYALLMVMLSLPMTLLLHAQSKWAAGL